MRVFPAGSLAFFECANKRASVFSLTGLTVLFAHLSLRGDGGHDTEDGSSKGSERHRELPSPF